MKYAIERNLFTMNKYEISGYRNNDPENKIKASIVANSEESVIKKLTDIGYHINSIKVVKENYTSGRLYEEKSLKIKLTTDADIDNNTPDTEIILTRLHDAIQRELDDMGIEYSNLSISPTKRK